MRNLRKPKWILIINSLPIAALFLIFYGEYNIINSLLSKESIELWKTFGLSLIILGLLNFAYAVYLIIKRKEIPLWHGVTTLLCFVLFLYFYLSNSEKIIPWSIPNWMVSENIVLYVLTFLMPSIIHSLFNLVVHFTPEEKAQNAWTNFLIAVIFPVTFFVFTSFAALGNFFHNSIHLGLIIIISNTLGFLFFLIRGVYILSLKNTRLRPGLHLAWKIPISIILPLLGLAVNNGFLFNNIRIDNSGVFGNFTNSWFYILAILNGILICLPNLENQPYRLLLFIGRSFTFAFTLYFFMVFLPFLPFSAIAVFLIGTGFLMLTPLVLFVIHLHELSTDYIFLKAKYAKGLLTLVSISGFLILPIIITSTYIKDKNELNKTLDYLHSPNYSQTYHIDKRSLYNTLEMVKQHKEGNRGGFFGNQTPYLSDFFNWLVLDNLTISDDKLIYIENIFFGKSDQKIIRNNQKDTNVVISKIEYYSRFDKNQHSWISNIELEITNNNANDQLTEFATTFDLPVGCFISDYYLYIGNRKEPGILAEKKSAMWLYSQIRNIRRDPGILCYLTGNKVAFHIYPFSKGEVRKTGIEFIHKDPVCLNIDSSIIKLGSNVEQNEPLRNTNAEKNVVYISALEKNTLKKIQRKPYYHFIIDMSAGKENQKENIIHRIESLMDKKLISNENAQISFVNMYTSTCSIKDNWKQLLKEQTCEGGYYLDWAIKKILFQTYKNHDNSYPVIVCVNDNLENAIIENDFSDFAITYPESDLFYTLDYTGDLIPHSLKANPAIQIPELSGINLHHEVLAYPNTQNTVAYLPDDSAASIILKNDIFDISHETIREKNWQSALTIQGKWISQVLHPETSDKEWPLLVRNSIMSKIMCPVTAFIAVENEAQKKILIQKQKQVLSGNKSFELGENTQIMSEPGLIVLIILFGLFILLLRGIKWVRFK